MLRQAGHEVAFAPFHGLQGVPLTWDGHNVYPGSTEDPWALDMMPAHYQHFKADLVITLMDAWVLDPGKIAGLNAAHWMPVDCDPLSAMDRRILDGAGKRPIAISRFGEAQLLEAGYDPLYAPHALDMQGTWLPLPDRDAMRRQLGMDGRFVIGVNAANQDPQRKGFGEQLHAFAEFARRHDDALMLIHSRAETRQGANLVTLINYLGLQGRAILGDQYQIAAGLIPEAQMALWHGVPDVLSNCSWGEGFGLAVLQSQACGTPVIVTDCSAMTELCGAGWLVPGQKFWNRGHDARWTIPLIPEITAAYEQAYEQAGSLREQAREFALAYDVPRVLDDYWKPALAELIPAAPQAALPVPVPSGPRRIWAPAMFRDELDMLDMRLSELGGFGITHVLAESNLTHRGLPKPLVLKENADRFAGMPVMVVGAELNPAPEAQADERARRAAAWANEHAQRDAAWRVIDAEADDSDVVLITDLDEIPSRALLERARAGELPEVCSVRMRVALHAVDLLVPPENLPPQCVIATAGYIRRHGGSLAAVRDRRDLYQVIPDGGWHFSWLGTPAEQARKLDESTCHTEILGTAEEALIRSGARHRGEYDGGLPVTPADVDDSWPEWIVKGKCPKPWFRSREEALTR